MVICDLEPKRKDEKLFAILPLGSLKGLFCHADSESQSAEIRS